MRHISASLAGHYPPMSLWQAMASSGPYAFQPLEVQPSTEGAELAQENVLSWALVDGLWKVLKDSVMLWV